VTLTNRRGVTIRARQEFRIHPVRSSSPPAPPETPAPVPGAPEAEAPAVAGAGAAMADVLQRLAAYVDAFEREFSSVVAEERYVQLVRPWRGKPEKPEDEPALEWTDREADVRRASPIIARRQLLSDVLLVQIPGQRWVGYRDVAVVQGRPVRDRGDRVRRLFLSRDADRDDQLSRISIESARYNLGNFRRNLNIPTLTLSFMRRELQERFRFTRKGDARLAGVPVWVIEYREQARPTMIVGPKGSDVPIEGRLWIEPGTGRVRQTEAFLQPRALGRTSIQVRYRERSPFTVLVPEYMWEWYENAGMAGRALTEKTLVECLARYEAFRRFSVETAENAR
jgi:hypothetical protein